MTECDLAILEWRERSKRRAALFRAALIIYLAAEAVAAILEALLWRS